MIPPTPARTTALILILAGGFSVLNAQSEQQLARYFKSNPQADLNGDGKLTREEARAHRQQSRPATKQKRTQKQPDVTRGDNLAPVSKIPGIGIPDTVSPLVEVALKSPDGIDLGFAYRQPPGNGPFPTILFFHGGGGHSSLNGLKQGLKTGAVQTRFLKEGFLVVAATRRPYWKTNDNPDKVGYFDAVEDASLVIRKAKTLPGVDPGNVILYGGSGGAILALGAAAKNKLAGVVAGEPATVLLLAPMTATRERPDYNPIMSNPLTHYPDALKRQTRALLAGIDCPVLIVQGHVSNLYKINNELLIPELKALKKDVSTLDFPPLEHGFYWGTVRAGATLETVETLVRDVAAYIGKRTTVAARKWQWSTP